MSQQPVKQLTSYILYQNKKLLLPRVIMTYYIAQFKLNHMLQPKWKREKQNKTWHAQQKQIVHKTDGLTAEIKYNANNKINNVECIAFNKSRSTHS